MILFVPLIRRWLSAGWVQYVHPRTQLHRKCDPTFVVSGDGRWISSWDSGSKDTIWDVTTGREYVPGLPPSMNWACLWVRAVFRLNITHTCGLTQTDLFCFGFSGFAYGSVSTLAICLFLCTGRPTALARRLSSQTSCTC
jgi:hypothetical protein